MTVVIGIVGEKGAGKDTFAHLLTKLLSQKKIAHIRFSDHLRATLDLWHLPQTRENLQKLAVVMNDGYGDTTVSDAVFHRIKDLTADIICVDGVRWQSDVELIQKFTHHLLIYITASPKIRFERLKQRGEKVGESKMSYQQFLKEEQAKNELLIPQIGQSAQVKIVNESTIDEFEREIKTKVLALLS